MEIYKITNKINGKVYIGQTIRPVEYRFNRHMNDALNNILDGIDSALNYMNEIRAEMEAEYYAEMMSNVDYY